MIEYRKITSLRILETVENLCFTHVQASWAAYFKASLMWRKSHLITILIVHSFLYWMKTLSLEIYRLYVWSLREDNLELLFGIPGKNCTLEVCFTPQEFITRGGYLFTFMIAKEFTIIPIIWLNYMLEKLFTRLKKKFCYGCRSIPWTEYAAVNEESDVRTVSVTIK